jgi:3',5'-cyclic AMP phosphodiesterase CpdA
MSGLAPASAPRFALVAAFALLLGLLALPSPGRPSDPVEVVPAAARPAPAQERPGTPADEVLRVAVISDLNERYGDTFHREAVHVAVARVRALHPDLVLIPGDMVAGQRPGLAYRAMWEAFRQAVVEPLAGVPLALSPGNHDASAYERYSAERALYGELWGEATHLALHDGIAFVDDADFPFRYAFTLGPALFVSLDVTTRHALGREQLDWLEAVLSRVDAQAHPTRVLFGHFPPYPFARGRERDYLLHDSALRARFVELVRTYGVDAYVSGHHHSYYPGRDPVTGMLLVGAGCVGGGPRVLLGEEREIEDLDDPRERSFVLLELDRSGVRSVNAFRGPGFGPSERIDPSSLPERVGLEELPIERAVFGEGRAD